MALVTHPKCGKQFPGSNTAGHCANCCETFMGLNAFEMHRIGEHGTPERCCEIQPTETIGDDGKTRYGHWADERGYWHYGRRQTKEEIAARFGKDEAA